MRRLLLTMGRDARAHEFRIAQTDAHASPVPRGHCAAASRDNGGTRIGPMRALPLPPMQPKFILLFLFSAPQGHLLEVKRLDLGADAPRSRAYLWLWVEQTTVRTLQFLSRHDGTRKQRTFEEGTLSFDDAQADMCWSDGTRMSMAAVPDRALPPFVSALIDQHLS